MRVRLNVGGVVYETESSTLNGSDFFRSLLSKEWKAQDDFFFIDRDGTLFRDVLNWLRRGRLIGGSTTADHYEELKEEAQFYGLEKLVIECQEKVEQFRDKERTKSMATVMLPISPKGGGGGFSPYRSMPLSAPVSQSRSRCNVQCTLPLPAFPIEEDDFIKSRVVCMNDDISPLDDDVCQSVCEGYDAGPRVIGDPLVEDF